MGKTGKYSPGNRVAFIDGYAGEGRYVSGEEGSPSLLVRKARELASVPRNLECYFVEDDPEVFATLSEVVAKEGVGLPVYLFPGKVTDHLPDLLLEVDNVPLLVFLDTYGLMIPFDLAVTAFTSRPAGPEARPTELLINFNAIFGAATGQARQTHLRKAWKRIYDDQLRIGRPFGPSTASGALGSSRQAISQHLEVLIGAGLVTSHREGRYKFHYIDTGPVRRLTDRWRNRETKEN